MGLALLAMIVMVVATEPYDTTNVLPHSNGRKTLSVASLGGRDGAKEGAAARKLFSANAKRGGKGRGTRGML